MSWEQKLIKKKVSRKSYPKWQDQTELLERPLCKEIKGLNRFFWVFYLIELLLDINSSDGAMSHLTQMNHYD